MKRVCVTTTRWTVLAAVAVLLAVAVPAAAQVPAPSQPGDDDAAVRPYSRWSLGVLSGPQQVGRTGVTLGGEIGIRLRRNLHLAIEAGWMSDVVTTSRTREIDGFVNYVQDAYTVPVTGSIEGPTAFGMVGFKFLPDGARRGEGAGVRPYVTATAGVARVEYTPSFVVDGQPVSGAGMILFNVAIGSDLLGTTNKFAYGGGAGLIFGDTWYLDLGARVLRIHTTDHPTTVKRLVIGMGRRF